MTAFPHQTEPPPSHPAAAMPMCLAAGVPLSPPPPDLTAAEMPVPEAAGVGSSRPRFAVLRCGDPHVIRAIAAGGGPVTDTDLLHIACVLCGCPMSQDAYIPNVRVDGCEDTFCWCYAPVGEA